MLREIKKQGVGEMTKEYVLKTTLEGIKLPEQDLAEIMDANQFRSKYLYGNDKEENIKKIEGKHFWLSGVRISSGNSLKRNQLPIHVVATINRHGGISFYPISNSGDLMLNKEVKLYDNAGNGLHVCETKLQAQYMYNKDLEKQMQILDSRIREVNSIKERFITLEQELDD